jgi:hypothetical protein
MVHLNWTSPADEDLDQVLPAGDLSIFADLGLDEMDLGIIAAHLGLFPDEALSWLAAGRAHARGRPGTMHDVRGRDNRRPDRAPGVRRGRPEGRRRRVAVGRAM